MYLGHMMPEAAVAGPATCMGARHACHVARMAMVHRQAWTHQARTCRVMHVHAAIARSNQEKAAVLPAYQSVCV